MSKQFYFKQFSLAQIRSLNAKNLKLKFNSPTQLVNNTNNLPS